VWDFIALIAFTMALSAQDASVVAAAAPACGPMDATFEVQKDGSHHATMQPEPGKALVYMVQEDCVGLGCPSTKVAVDGTWMGANLNKSYFSFATNPGVHHVCVTLRSRSSIAPRFVGLLHFTAEAGESYYFRTRLLYGEGGDIISIDLDRIDSDQGKFLTAAYPPSVSHPVK